MGALKVFSIETNSVTVPVPQQRPIGGCGMGRRAFATAGESIMAKARRHGTPRVRYTLPLFAAKAASMSASIWLIVMVPPKTL